MAILECKMCGGTLEITESTSVCQCEYCGTRQTVPALDDDVRNQIFDRANYYRMGNEFDKASMFYENLLKEAPEEAEAYWGLCLCRYGIEYVEDPRTRKRIPTCHRTQFKSILEDQDYLSALKYADSVARTVYREEAEYIDSVQKGILAISSKEKPFDIFICYKESDESGNRTIDSVIAQDIYTALTEKGYKVFFARITLEDKLGSAYEPYIFAALNSARVMLVVGTKKEYFNAVWVKNEWSRYLALIEQGQKKNIIPCYRNMSAYDLPDQFVALQSQDVSKVGYMQDLLRGVEKIVGSKAPPAAPNTTATVQITALVKRIYLFLEDGDWEQAKTYCEKVLDLDPECAQAYVGALLAQLKLKNVDALAEYPEAFDENGNYQKALRYADDRMKEHLTQLVAKNRGWRAEQVYQKATYEMNREHTEEEYREIAKEFASISWYKDAAELEKQCKRLENRAHKKVQYDTAAKRMRCVNKIEEYLEIAKEFAKIQSYPNAAEMCCECRYLYANGLLRTAKNEQDYKTAAAAFSQILGYKDSGNKQTQCYHQVEVTKRNEAAYQNALQLMKSFEIPKITQAHAVFSELGYFSSARIYQECCEELPHIIQTINELRPKMLTLREKRLGMFGDMWRTEFDAVREKLFPLYRKYEEIMYLFEKREISRASIGDFVHFGDYEWLVLNRTQSSATLIAVFAEKDYHFLSDGTKYCKKIMSLKYHNKKEAVTWESSWLRQWLNHDFYQAAFSIYEKDAIIETQLMTPDNQRCNTKGGAPTKDRVYLLSAEEAAAYFKGKRERRKVDSSFWWLRSPGSAQNRAMSVTDKGQVWDGFEVDYSSGLHVHPVINVKIQ